MRNNLYSICCEEISARFREFYQSFATVIGAQMTISCVNTLLTAIFVSVVQLPYAPVVIGLTFLCGLVPIVGNVVSNTVIVLIDFLFSPKVAIGALVFLIVIHKLEYFLNSKIIGARIRRLDAGEHGIFFAGPRHDGVAVAADGNRASQLIVTLGV